MTAQPLLDESDGNATDTATTAAATTAATTPPDIDLEASLAAAEAQDARAALESAYYDAAAMASLTPRSLAALGRLRAYRPPAFPLWDALPARRRAGVLVLLYADAWGDLRVVVTMRAASLRSFSGQAALPCGKADSRDETPYQIARREAFEEIGLPVDDARLPRPFAIEPLCLLPPALARTHLVVTLCVAFLRADAPAAGDADADAPLVDESLMPRLDAREVAAVFSAPLYGFLKAADLPPRPGQALPPGHWYDGAWLTWRVHNFYVPVNNQRVSTPGRRRGGSGSDEADVDIIMRAHDEGAFADDADRKTAGDGANGAKM